MALRQNGDSEHQRGGQSRLKQARLPWSKRWSSSTLPSSRASTMSCPGTAGLAFVERSENVFLLGYLVSEKLIWP